MRRIQFLTTLLFVVLFGSFSATTVLAQEEDALSQKVRGLNNALLKHLDQFERFGDPGSRKDLTDIIVKRQAVLEKLVQKSAEKGIGLAMPEDIVRRITAILPEAAAILESYGDWQGTLECTIKDDATMTKREMVHNYRTKDGLLEIHFSGTDPDTKAGDVYQVKGVKVGKHIAVSDYQKDVVTQAATCSTQGVQNTIVLLVTFPGITPPANVTTSSVTDIFFGASGKTVNGYWKEASYNKASAAGDVKGWYTLDRVYTCDEYYAMRTAAITAADADVTFPNYTRLFIVFPNPGGCSYAGLGTLGCTSLSSNDGSFTASTAWQLSAYMDNQDEGTKLSTHEGGHNLTLHHARSRDYVSEPLGQPGTTGTFSEYGDTHSTMGSWNLGHYAAGHKVRLGWLTSGGSDNDRYQVVNTNGNYTILPTESTSSGVKGLKVQRGTCGSNGHLWIEYRQPVGLYDSTLNSQVFTGALIHQEDSSTSTYTDLLDFFNPATTGFSDPALGSGQSWTDTYTNLSLNVTSATSSGLTVNVSYGPNGCTQANPTVTLSPSNPSLYPGNSVNYTVTVKNNESCGCNNATFGLSTTQPSGWNTSWSATSITLAPGQSGSVTMTKTAPSNAALGTYPVNATATNGSYTGTGTANATVTSPPPPLTVTVNVPGSTYSVRQTVPTTTTVYSGSSPASGATVNFVMTKANGAKVYKTLTTNASGTATWNYKIATKDPKGSWSVTATATLGSQNGTGNTDTFTVQ